MTKPVVRDTKYGYTPDHPDYRDHHWTAPRLATLPASVDLRPQMPPVFNQGNIGSCTAQALGGLLQYDEIKQNKADKNTPSRLFIYYNERSLQGTVNSDSGSSLRTGIQSLIYYGFCDESLWTYNTAAWSVKPPQTAYQAAVPEKISSYARIYQDVNQMKTSLAAGNPFAFGFMVYQNFESAYTASTGIVSLPSGYFLGGHAVLAVGYDDAHQWFIVRNSWGNNWGAAGYCFLPYQYLASSSLALDFWSVSFVP